MENFFKVEVFHPRYDGNSYSYNNPIEPEFGFGPEKSILDLWKLLRNSLWRLFEYSQGRNICRQNS